MASDGKSIIQNKEYMGGATRYTQAQLSAGYRHPHHREGFHAVGGQSVQAGGAFLLLAALAGLLGVGTITERLSLRRCRNILHSMLPKDHKDLKSLSRWNMTNRSCREKLSKALKASVIKEVQSEMRPETIRPSREGQNK